MRDFMALLFNNLPTSPQKNTTCSIMCHFFCSTTPKLSYCTSAISIKHVFMGGVQCLISYRVLCWEWLLDIWIPIIPTILKRALPALEIYNFPRHKFGYTNRRYTCIHGYIHTGILWPYHLKFASYGPVITGVERIYVHN